MARMTRTRNFLSASSAAYVFGLGFCRAVIQRELIQPCDPAFQFRRRRWIPGKYKRIVARNDVLTRTRQSICAAISLHDFSDVIRNGVWYAALHVRVKMRSIRCQHHSSAAGFNSDDLHPHGMPAHVMHAETRGDFFVAIVKNETA